MGYLAIRKHATKVRSKESARSGELPHQSKTLPLLNKQNLQLLSSDWSYAKWFLANKDTFPKEPFRIDRAVFISDPKKYFDYLEREIEKGEENFVFKTGSLQADLAKLRKIFSEERV